MNFMLYEEFANEAALQTHRARPEMAAHLRPSSPCSMPRPTDFWSQALTNAKPAGGKTGEAGHVTLVRFRMKPDTVDAVLDAIGGDLDDMQGNIRFDLNRGRADPLDCMSCARWVSRAVWEAQPRSRSSKTLPHTSPRCSIFRCGGRCSSRIS